ncbi:hypothetical protein DL240_00405 [Lujinxingia litoralis]|uniref:Tetratricopeptide repeat protein n=1 Tax=Lujinxingia litoralis TaxID=2211119 RepID=A0A328C8F0_9DELT|nr:hypothetical protein [Lujinxingia litoralis]RAL24705.1 hypothetical protein DL240_00405 [Lujinxingia litoralis]
MNTRHTLLTALACALFLSACARANKPTESAIIVPSAATTAPHYRGDGSIPAQRYVVRMSDGQRDWEVEFPEVATGYEMRIPLGTESSSEVFPTHHPLTQADKELIDHLRRTDPNFEREGAFVDGEHVLDRETGEPQPRQRPDGQAEAEPAPSRPSYYRGVEDIKRLAQAGSHEMALVHLVELERHYPGDVQLLMMKGTLWSFLGRPSLARQAWEEVLQIDPENREVIDALRQLEQGVDDLED